MAEDAVRGDVLSSLGATLGERAELLRYNRNHFDRAGLDAARVLPLDDEPFVSVWADYAREAEASGAWAALRRALVQLRFPIAKGMSTSADYVAATRRVVPVSEDVSALRLRCPDQLRIELHATPAGRLPVLIAPCRHDFVLLVQALTKRNEPAPILDSVGACMVAGYNNIDRLLRLKERWRNGQLAPTEEGWRAQLRAILPRKEIYQDRFIIASTVPYSATPADAIGLDVETWARLSLAIRIEHESVHYVTRRLFGSMKNRLLDELVADYAGILYATGRYRADWAMRFLGLESFPRYRPGGRLEYYRGHPPLSDGAFAVLQRLAKAATDNLKAFDADRDRAATDGDRFRIVVALTRLTVEEIAAPDAGRRLRAALDAVEPHLQGAPLRALGVCAAEK